MAQKKVKQPPPPPRLKGSATGFWALLTLLLTLVSSISIFSGQEVPFRALWVIGFYLLAPGLTIANMLDFAEWGVTLMLATALSLALTMLVSLVLLIFKQWDPELGYAVLAVFVVIGTGIKLLQPLLYPLIAEAKS